MNEQKKQSVDFFNNNVSEQKIDVADLVAKINHFLCHEKPEPSDWILLDKLAKQLNKQKYNVSRKVFRSMQNKFVSIQSKYQR